MSSKFRIARSANRIGEPGGAPADEGDTPITHLARTFRTLADESNVLHLLNRYETRFSREYTRALACLGQLRVLREQRERQRRREAKEARRRAIPPAEIGEIQ